MFHLNNSNRSNLTRMPALGVVSALLWGGVLHSETAYAEDAAAFRARVIREVLKEVPDLELAKQIAEIRINREFLNQQSSATNPAPQKELAPKAPIERRVPIKQSVQGANEYPVAVTANTGPKASDRLLDGLNAQSGKRTNDVYVGVGNRLVVGYSYPISTEFSLRADLAGLPTREGNESIDGNQFAVKEINTSLGAYLDWFPSGGDFRLSAGLNVNRMQTRLQSVQGTNANLNGKTFNTGSEELDIKYKFPLYTPYLGIGYLSAAADNGWSMYADLGLMFGKYDAHARTSMIGLHSVTSADVAAELNTLRDGLFKRSYVPVGAVGVKYRY